MEFPVNVTLVCSHCDCAFVWETRPGRNPVFCSDLCRRLFKAAAKRAERAARAPAERPSSPCRVCGVLIPPAPIGRPRVYCSPACSEEAIASRREDHRDYLRKRDVIALDEAGVSQSGFVVERPLPSAGIDRNMLGSGDIDLTSYMDQEWAVQFVAEFGFSGCDVGQTYPNAGRTLGSD